MSAPFGFVGVLTESWDFDIMHRRAGRDAVPQVPWKRRNPHADAHKNCPFGRCGTRPGAYHGGEVSAFQGRSAKITSWRIAKARANRAYLEERVYGQPRKA